MFKIEYKCAYIYFKNGTTEVSISYMLQKQINMNNENLIEEKINRHTHL